MEIGRSLAMRAGAGNIEAGPVEERMQRRLMGVLMVIAATVLWMAAGWLLFQAAASAIVRFATLSSTDDGANQAVAWNIAGGLLSSAVLALVGYFSWRLGNREH